MANQEYHSTLLHKLLVGVTVVALVGGVAVLWWNGRERQPLPSDAPTTEATTTGATAYVVEDTGTGVALVPVALPKTNAADPAIALEQAFDFLLGGEVRTVKGASAIPKGTELHSLALREDGVHVDFSAGFTEGGGSASAIGRLGQVIYTATSIAPEMPVWISVEGEPLEVLGGEGVEISQPMTRQQFREQFPIQP